MYKRHIPVSRGRSNSLFKRTSHIRIELGAEASGAQKSEPKKPVVKAEKAPEKKEAAEKEPVKKESKEPKAKS